MKAFVAIVFIALMMALAIAFVLRGRGEGRDAAEAARPVARTQDLVNFSGFDGRCAVAMDGTHVSFIHVDGKNMGFATPEERDLDAEALGIALAGMRRPFRIHRCQRPIDATVPQAELRAQIKAIDAEISELRAGRGGMSSFAADKAVEALEGRRALIEEIYLPRTMGASDVKYETDVYVTMGFEDGPNVIAEADEETAAFVSLLASAGYSSRVMGPDEVVERIVNYFGRFPVRAENSDPYCAHDAACAAWEV